jgi:hypothetical protein
MRSVRSAFFFLSVTALMGGAIGACSASGVGIEDEGALPDEEDDDAAADTGTKRDAGKDTGKADAPSNAVDSGKPDATTADAKPDNSVPDTGTGTSDAAPDAPKDAPADVIPADAALPPVGSPCATANEIQNQACGMCGTQSRVCKDSGSGLVWHAWGFCQNEVVGGCVPGTTVNEACGLCGRMTRLCQADCRYANQACTGQPANACNPGTIEFKVGLSCDAGGRSRTCENTCTWGNYGQCTEPVNQFVLTASGTLGTIVASPDNPNRWEMRYEPATPYKKVNTTTTCPTTVGASNTQYQYTEIKNPTSEPIKVQIWQEISGSSTDSIMAAYAGAIIPPDDAARRTCLSKVNDGCPSTSETGTTYAMNGAAPNGCGGSSIAGLHNIQIAANSSIMVYNAMYFAPSSTSTPSGVPFQLKVRTICSGAACP